MIEFRSGTSILRPFHPAHAGNLPCRQRRARTSRRHRARTRARTDSADAIPVRRSEEHTSELQSLMRISYAVFCLKKKTSTEYDRIATPTIPTHRTTNVSQTVKHQDKPQC